MTAQITDTLIYDRRWCSIVGVKGEGLFNPKDLGLSPVATITSCWRGYVCIYVMSDQRLLLDRLDMSLGTFEGRDFHPQPGPVINGVAPAGTTGGGAAFGSGVFRSIYENLSLQMPFTGGLLAADEFIRELYVHMGFHPAWKYKTVFELLFDKGVLTETRDVSERMAEIRNQMAQRPLRPGQGAPSKEIQAWIESAFKLDYDL